MATVDYTKPRSTVKPPYSTKPEKSSLTQNYKRILTTIFSTTGRMNRQRYIKYLTLLWLPIVAIISYLHMSGNLSAILMTKQSTVSILAITILTIIPSLCIGIKRGHDMERSTLLSLFEIIRTAIVPGLIVYSFTKGSVGYNQYGPDPLQKDSI